MARPKLIDNCENCTGNWKNFIHLTKDELKLVNENRYEATFKPGEVMIKQGAPASNVLFMANGLSKIYIEGLNGKNFMMGIGMPGGMLMSPGAYMNSRHNFSVAAITTVQACFVNFEIIRKIIRENGLFAESILQDMSEKNVNAYTRMVHQVQKRMSGRLAEILLYFADDVFRKDEFDMILSRQELGEMASMAKECVVRILREFEESGVIDSNSSRIKILDRDRLALISERG
jgi:CRP-like cAMP-binding protein